MRTVLIFAYECAPHHGEPAAMAAQRPASLARYLPAGGWRAIIIACDAKRRRSATRASLPRIREDVGRVLRASPAAQSVVIPVPSLAWSGPVDGAWWTLARRPSAPAWMRPLRKALTVVKWASGDYSQSWQEPALAAADVVAAAERVDFCMGEHTPDAGLFLARRFAARHALPWAVDFRDPALSPDGPVARTLRAPLIRRLVRGSSFTIAVNPYWRDLDEAEYGNRAHCIPNGFDPAEFDGSSPPRDPHRVIVAYAGNVHRGQDPTTFLRGIAALRARRGASGVRSLTFIYRGGSAELVAAAADREGVASCVDVAPAIPRPDALRMLRSADLLLLLSARGERHDDPLLARGFWPGKAFECLGARRPVLCTPGDRGQLDGLMRATGAGIICPTPESVATALGEALDLKRRGEDIPWRGDPAVVASYSRREQALDLARLLDAAVAT